MANEDSDRFADKGQSSQVFGWGGAALSRLPLLADMATNDTIHKSSDQGLAVDVTQFTILFSRSDKQWSKFSVCMCPFSLFLYFSVSFVPSLNAFFDEATLPLTLKTSIAPSECLAVRLVKSWPGDWPRVAPGTSEDREVLPCQYPIATHS